MVDNGIDSKSGTRIDIHFYNIIKELWSQGDNDASLASSVNAMELARRYKIETIRLHWIITKIYLNGILDINISKPHQLVIIVLVYIFTVVFRGVLYDRYLDKILIYTHSECKSTNYKDSVQYLKIMKYRLIILSCPRFAVTLQSQNRYFITTMKIGNIEFGSQPLFLAPMEDVTDIGFLMLCKRFGAAMVYTEFVSAEALVRSIKSTVNKLMISDEERPVGIQIYGRTTADMVEAAKIVEQAHPDVIDINFGCPVKKVAGKGAGAGMLRNIPLMLDITREVVKAVNVPVTVKTRLGWDNDNLIITELAEQLQDCGIQALTIHGRTRSQMYTGEADWSLIGEVKNNPRIHIPIIGNGDITTPEEAKLAFERYGVDAVMIGRATFGRPWIFKEIRDYLDNTGAAPLTVDEKIDLLEEQLRINVERIDEYRGILHTRRHLAASPIFKGIPDFRQTRIAMLRATTVEELKEILKECRERIKAIE